MVDKYEALERLSKLKADGVLTEDEFAAEKARLLTEEREPISANAEIADRTSSASLKRRAMWMVPIVLIVAAILIGINAGNSAVGAGNATADPPAETADTRLPQCDSHDVREMMTDAIEHNVAEKIATLRVLDITNLVERSYDPDKIERVCAADLTLNTGDEHTGFRLYLSSNGTVLFRTMDDPGVTASEAAPTSQETATENTGSLDDWEKASRDVIENDDSRAADALVAADADARRYRDRPGLSLCLRTPNTLFDARDALSCVKGGRQFTMAASVYGIPVAYNHADQADPSSGRLPMVSLDAPPVYNTEAQAEAIRNPKSEECVVKGGNDNGSGWFASSDMCLDGE